MLFIYFSPPPTISNSVFQIPDAHLEGVSIYSGADPESVREVLKPGPGVNNTDVILYIVSKTTKLCVTHVSKKYIYVKKKSGRGIIIFSQTGHV